MSDWPIPVAAASHDMDLIATTALSGAAASITFSGIDTTYRFFEIVLWGLNDANVGGCGVQLNADNGANYAEENIYGNGGTLGSARRTGINSLNNLLGQEMSIDASVVFSAHITIGKPLATGYAAGEFIASVISGAALWLQASGLSWANTADLISSIAIVKSSNNFAIGTRASLGGARTA